MLSIAELQKKLDQEGFLVIGNTDHIVLENHDQFITNYDKSLYL